MILADTNIWVYAAGEKFPAIAAELGQLVRAGKIVGHPFVYGELLLMPTGPARQTVIDRYMDLEQLGGIKEEGLWTFIKVRKLAGKGVGYVDASLLFAAYTFGGKLWTTDGSLKTLAVSMGLAHETEKA